MHGEKILDTVGAGDAFVGAFCAALASASPLYVCLQRASTAVRKAFIVCFSSIAFNAWFAFNSLSIAFDAWFAFNARFQICMVSNQTRGFKPPDAWFQTRRMVS
jgi:hypothetical protein